MKTFKLFYIIVLLILSTIAAQAVGLPITSSQEHMQIVNQQMDQVERSQATQNFASDYEIFPKKVYWDLEIAPEVSYIRYNEPSFAKESGYMSGINGIFTYHPPLGDALNTPFSDMFRLEGRFSYGKVDYSGGIQNGNGPTTPETFNGISDYMAETRGLAGKDFNFNNGSIRLTPYLGIGYRMLFDAFYANKPGGYDRRIQYIYVPTGAEIMTKLTKGWSIGADAEYDIFIRGYVTSYLGEIGLGDVRNTQKDGYGLRGSLKLVGRWDRFNLIFEPFVRYWNIHRSQLAQSTPFFYNGQEYVIIGDEPANTSLEIGGKLGIEF